MADKLETLEATYTTIKSVLDGKSKSKIKVASDRDLITVACQNVAQNLGITLRIPHVTYFDSDKFIFSLAKLSNFKIRKIQLNENFWQQDGGPLVVKYQGKPCALIPHKTGGGYILIRSDTGERKLVKASIARDIESKAYIFYPGLKNKIVGMKDVLQLAFRGRAADFRKIVGFQFLAALLALSMPLMTELLFDTIIPNADISLLYQIFLILLVITFTWLALEVIEALCVIHFRFKAQAVLEPAIWDRLLKLPVKFFRGFSSGDLADRASVINSIQESVSQSTIISLLGVVNLISFISLLFFYNVTLAFVVFVIILIVIPVNVYFVLKQISFSERELYYQGKELGLVFQIITGLHKFKAHHAEDKAFRLWARWFSKKSKKEIQSSYYDIAQDVFNSVVSIFSYLAFYVVAFSSMGKMSMGEFMAANAAFVGAIAAFETISSSLEEIAHIIPLYRRALPIFQAEPEDCEGRYRVEKLRGSIEVKNVSFQYDKLAPPVFKDLTLEIKSGEVVGIMGPSGAGKSTLLRLLLGFEEPTAGSISYDGIRLDSLRLDTLREQFGVVTQNSELIPGSIIQNIIGNSPALNRKDAWEIADFVGAADFIRKMPMGMDTLVNDGMESFSGGEIQRLVLARAIANKPKILFLDEATSALDNESQARVQNYLKETKTTQLIVAHRLSTLAHADKICVMEQGTIVQSGSFTELAQAPGLFKELMSSQALSVID